MSVTVTSTTDSNDAVLAATGAAKVDSVKEEKESASSEKLNEKKEESDASKKNLTDDEETDSSDSQDDADDGDEPKDGEQKPKNNGFKKKINKLIKRASNAEQERDFWKAEAVKVKPVQQTQQVDTPKTEVSSEGKPDPDKFESNVAYLEAVADWKVDQREKQREAAKNVDQVKADYQKKAEAFQSSLQEFKTKHDDFDDAMEEVSDVILSAAHQEAIFTSSMAPELMYELAKNKDELVRISKMSFTDALREVGKIEARISKSSESKEIKQTKAPPPISPVGSKSSSRTAKSPDEMDYQEYKKWRENNK